MHTNQRRLMKLSPIALFLVLLPLTACELFESEPDTTVVATGTVVLAETGEPLGGLGVVFRATGGFGSSAIIRARTTTAEDGSFELIFDGSEGGYYLLSVNDNPYDDRYGAYDEGISAGSREDFGVIELSRIED